MPRELTITLSDELAEQAEPLGLLKPEAVEDWLRAEIRRQSWKRLTEAMSRMDADGTIPPMTSEEIEAEIEAARAERRTLPASGA